MGVGVVEVFIIGMVSQYRDNVNDFLKTRCLLRGELCDATAGGVFRPAGGGVP